MNEQQFREFFENRMPWIICKGVLMAYGAVFFGAITLMVIGRLLAE